MRASDGAFLRMTHPPAAPPEYVSAVISTGGARKYPLQRGVACQGDHSPTETKKKAIKKACRTCVAGECKWPNCIPSTRRGTERGQTTEMPQTLKKNKEKGGRCHGSESPPLLPRVWTRPSHDSEHGHTRGRSGRT